MSENKVYKRRIKTGWKVVFAIVIITILLTSGGFLSSFGNISKSSINSMSSYDSSFAVNDTGSSNSSSSSDKWTKSADFNIDSVDFDKTCSTINKLIDKYDAEAMSKHTGKNYYDYYKNSDSDDDSRYITMRVKVDATKFDEFISDIENIKNVDITYKSVDADNISDEYEDIQSRIESLKVRIERYQELLKNATEVSDIQSISESLDEAQDTLDSYQRVLNGRDNSVVYSYVDICVIEQYTLNSNKTIGFGYQIFHAFKTGCHNFVNSAVSLIVYIIGHLLYIVAIIIAIILLRKFHVFKKISNLFTEEVVVEKVSKKDADNNSN